MCVYTHISLSPYIYTCIYVYIYIYIVPPDDLDGHLLRGVPGSLTLHAEVAPAEDGANLGLVKFWRHLYPKRVVSKEECISSKAHVYYHAKVAPAEDGANLGRYLSLYLYIYIERER